MSFQFIAARLQRPATRPCFFSASHHRCVKAYSLPVWFPSTCIVWPGEFRRLQLPYMLHGMVQIKSNLNAEHYLCSSPPSCPAHSPRAY